ncbi:hypothetical protein JRF84_34305 [Methylobacterium organophilum]|uniref:hypothetical protein n=1 Tax=Methylobacterium organophilum TaxID=410 RepID=UPI0004B4925D|nr:hypothetical protein [Methylobacterium organophilum]MBN6824636.1 hypothetical protein [Methylobacterium organophilum]
MPGLNLRNIANGAIQGLNPNVIATVRRAAGYTTDASGKRTPSFTEIVVPVQIQPITTGDMQKLDNLNIQGVHRAIYVSAEVEAMIRVDKKGGDQIVFPRGVMPEDNDNTTRWIVSAVLEVYQSGWRKCAITLQNSYSQ